MQLKDATILIVEDEPMLLEITEEWFRSLAGKVLTAPNGAVALKSMENEKVHAILTDVRMPVMDGVALLKSIKASGTHTPSVIFITGFSDVNLREAMDLGAEAALTKPVNRKELTRTVETVLTTRTELWSRPSAGETGQVLKQSFISMPDAAGGGKIAFGTGGFCIWSDRELEIGPVQFAFDFATEQKQMRGVGTVRWEDPHALKAGIEIAYLDQSCRSWVLALTSQCGNGSFIPRDTTKEQVIVNL